jgi:[NiFe] hydrogenase assembly HybE family chaperone
MVNTAPMIFWQQNPAPVIERVFSEIARTRMADFPLANTALTVEAPAFQYWQHKGQALWLGVLITPWAMNLLCLPAAGGKTSWPDASPGNKHRWRFPSGVYEFTVAEVAELGRYHLCSLFSPPADFPNQTLARQTAQAALLALLHDETASQQAANSAGLNRRRAFLGLSRKPSASHS